jgi:hypothetical protein
VEGDACIQQRALYCAVAGDRLRLVVVVRVHRLHAQRAGIPRDLVARPSVQKREAAAEPFERVAQLGDALPDELHAPIRALLQRIEDFGVEHEHAVHGARRPQGVMQGGVILAAQVAPEPHQRGIVAGAHQPARRCSQRTATPSPGIFPYSSSAVSQ